MTRDTQDTGDHHTFNALTGGVSLLLYGVVWLAVSPESVLVFIAFALGYWILLGPWTDALWEAIHAR